MKFETIVAYPDAKLPERATKYAAGYDFYIAAETVCPPGEITLIPTGVKCELDKNCWLQLAVRSSTPKKKHLMLANGIGIIDADYYNNPDNEGHIMFQVYNFGKEPVTLEKNDRIGQGVICRYEVTDDDMAKGLREGGFGSTDAASILSKLF